MRRILDFFQNTFLMLILIGLFALPLLVNLNLTPIVDESLAGYNTSQVIEDGETSNMVARRKDDNDVLGTQEVRYPGIRVENISLNEVLADERVLQDTGKRYFSMVKLLPSRGQREENENLYLIRNNSNDSQAVKINIDGDENELVGIELSVSVGDKSYEIYDGAQFQPSPMITLNPGEEEVISADVIYNNLEFDGAILSIRINLI